MIKDKMNGVRTYHRYFYELDDRLKTFMNYLSEDEYLRANSFSRRKDQRKFILSRGYLREILSNELDLKPDEVNFVYGLNGKPEIANTKKCFFNLSHSKDSILIAISKHNPIGVDVEENRTIDNNFLFHPKEINYFHTLPIDKQQMNKLWIWTRKEAICKASGEGLSTHLKTIPVLEDEIQFNYKVYRLNSELSKHWAMTICTINKA